ncbi:MAG: FAD-dependent oxidoreductase [Planctomycetota bacterium]
MQGDRKVANKESPRKRILILGGGFGGVYTAMHLESLLGRKDDYEITLVNGENYFVFQPMLPEVVSGNLGPSHVVSPLRRLLPQTQIYIRQVESIDVVNKTVTLSPGFRPRSLVLTFDHLVLALGNVTDFRGMSGLREHAFPFKNLADANRLRNHLIHVLAEADVEADVELRKQLLTFVIAGGGFSGVEVAAELNDFVRRAVRYFHNIDPAELRVLLIHSGKRILDKELVERLGLYAQELLRKRGMEIRLGARIEAATPDWAIVKGGERIPTKTLISTVPSSPNPILEAAANLPKERGRIKVTRELEVEGMPGIWALGDCALIPAAKGEGFCPPTAQFAVREGRVVAKNIVATIRGGAREVFQFNGLGKMGALGHRRAVAEMLGVRLSGIVAWVIWRAVYWMKMPGLDRKIRVGVDWLLDFLIPPELVQLRLDDGKAIEHVHYEPGEMIVRQGDSSEYLYIVVKGEGKASWEHNGKTEILGTVGEGEFFGESAVLDNVPYRLSLECTAPMDAIRFHKSEFRDIVTSLPSVRSNIDKIVEKRLATYVEKRGGDDIGSSS